MWKGNQKVVLGRAPALLLGRWRRAKRAGSVTGSVMMLEGGGLSRREGFCRGVCGCCVGALDVQILWAWWESRVVGARNG